MSEGQTVLDHMPALRDPFVQAALQVLAVMREATADLPYVEAVRYEINEMGYGVTVYVHERDGVPCHSFLGIAHGTIADSTVADMRQYVMVCQANAVRLQRARQRKG